MKKLNFLQIVYLVLAAFGAIIPWYFNIHHLMHSEVPFTIVNFFSGGFVNDFASSLVSDFFIGGIAVLIFMMYEGQRLKMKHMWVYFVLTCFISFAFACPLFLFFRERKLSELMASSLPGA